MIKQFAVVLISLAAWSGSAGPIVAVLNGSGDPGNVAGYGASGFHAADDTSPMSGASLATITGATGDFTNGVLDVDLIWDTALRGVTQGNLSGNLSFDSSGSYLLSDTTLVLDFGGGNTTTFNVNVGSGGGPICCSGSYAPNSFQPGTNTDDWVLTLWAADDGYWTNANNTQQGSSNYPRIGMDLQLQVQVPEPGTTLLLGSGLALLGLRLARKNRAAP